MSNDNVTIFRAYPFRIGQKINIDGTKRSGDWEVIGVDENKITLRCPITDKEITTDPFCFFVEEKIGIPWPGKRMKG